MARKAAKKEVAVKRATVEQLSLLIAPVITEKSNASYARRKQNYI